MAAVATPRPALLALLALALGACGEGAIVSRDADAPTEDAAARDGSVGEIDAPAQLDDRPTLDVAPTTDTAPSTDATPTTDVGVVAPPTDLGIIAPPTDVGTTTPPPRDAGTPPPDPCPVAPTPVAERLMIGLADSNQNMFDNPGFDRFFVSAGGVQHRRLAHYYAHWNVALLAPTDPDRVKLQTWLDRAACHGVEPMVAFTPNGPLPVPAQYDNAFARFRATWPQVQAFTAWNEPNGPDSWPDSARTAADIYLRALTRCRPGSGCVVAAGDMAATVPGRTRDFAMDVGPDRPCGRAACSWLDRYKFSIDEDGATYGFPHHRPAYWAVHNWADAFHYERNGNHCNDNPATCVTAAFSASLQGSWARTEIWMTEVGGVLEGAGDQLLRQQCTARFFYRLFTDGDPRVRRWYYYSFAGVGATGDSGACPFAPLSSGRCFADSGASTRPVFDALRNRSGANLPGCP
ncbi:MAG: hypothetical protein JWM10_183 [Myxococcaceae bacterium]|nr:hypothetical protein [Myxococcaceae bacterium]